MTKRTYRVRKIKWIGTALVLAVSAFWVASLFGLVKYTYYPHDPRTYRSDYHWSLSVGRGCVILDEMVWGDAFPWHQVYLDRDDIINWPHRQRFAADIETFIPIWPLILLLAGPVILCWRLDKPAQAGLCRCGYNLTGNVSGVCPECGAKIN
jgi:hypothetical protein